MALWLLGSPLIGAAPVLPADSDHYTVDLWQVEDGLPQNSVTSIKQAPDGYLWLGTFNGLARFDGVRFTVFDEGNTPALGSSRVVRLDIGPRGDLWIVTEEGGLTRMFEGQFRKFTAQDGLPATGAAGVVRGPGDSTLLIDRAGRVHRFDDGKWVPDARGEFSRGNLISLFTDPDGNCWIWFRDRGTMGRFADGQLLLLKQPGQTQNASVRSFAPRRAGGLWLVISNKVWQYQTKGQEWLPTAWELPEPGRAITYMLEDQRGNLWLGTYGHGLLRLGPSGGLERLTTRNGLSHNVVRALWEDREGSIWAGTDGGGLNRLKPRNVVMFDVRHGLPADAVMSMAKDPNDTDALWLGVNGGGINRLCNGKVSPLAIEPLLHTNSFVYGTFADRAGGLWIGTYDQGTWRYHNGALTCLVEKARWAGKPLLAGLEDQAGTTWLAGGFGLCQWRNGQLIGLNDQLGATNLIVRALAEDQAGHIYVGTYGRGLSRLVQGHWIHYSEQNGLPDAHITALYVDGESTLWVGTANGGLCRFRQGRFTTITVRDGIPSNSIFTVIEDGLDHLWLGSNRGLIRINRRELNDYMDAPEGTLSCHVLNRADGLNSIECGGGAQASSLRTPDNRLWFATVRGLAVVDPKQLRLNPLPPPVVIEEIVLDGQPVADRRSTIGGRDLDAVSCVRPGPTVQATGRGRPGELVIGPGKHRLEIRFTGLSLLMPDKVRFRYWIEGLDKGWVDAGANRTVSYAHIPPGEYRFQVVACNNDGVWNNAGAELGITVLPPWWRTWWFRLWAIAAVGGLLSWLLHLHWRRAQHERAVEAAFTQRVIRSQEEERQRIAAELHDSIGQDLLVIKNRALLGLHAQGTSDPGQQLQEISQVATQSLEEVREISWNLRPYHIDRLGLTKAVEVMVRTAASAAGLNCAVKLGSVDGLLAPKSEIHLYRIVQELLNNVIKHSDASEAVVDLRPASDRLILTVQDDGRGFNYSAVFGRPAAEHGLGLTDISERVHILGGKLQCDSRPGRGARWHIEIPIATAKP